MILNSSIMNNSFAQSQAFSRQDNNTPQNLDNTPLNSGNHHIPLNFNTFRDDLNALPDWVSYVRIRDKKAAMENKWEQKKLGAEEVIKPRRGQRAIGVNLGEIGGGLVALDFDGIDESGELDAFLNRELPEATLPPTVTLTSGKPGRRCYLYRIPQEHWEGLEGITYLYSGRRDGKTIEQIEFRWNKHYQVILGEHPETGSYRWIAPPTESEIAIAPPWVITALKGGYQSLADKFKPKPRPPVESPPAEKGDTVSPLKTPQDSEKALACLAHIPVAWFDDYESWVKVGMALHATDPGLLGAWENWSRGSEKYTEGECEKKWRSFSPKAGGVGLGSLINWAKENGFTIPRDWIDTSPRPKPVNGRLPQNQWNPLSEHNYQMGFWADDKTPWFDETDPETLQILTDNPNLKEKWEKTKNNPSRKPKIMGGVGPLTVKDDNGEKVTLQGWKESLIFVPKANFIFSIERILQSETNGGGYVLRIERNVNGKLVTSRATVNGADCLKVSDFISAINKSLGLHLVCNAKIDRLTETLHVKTEDYYAKNRKVARLADRHGCQDDGVWVFENAQYNPDGTPTDESKSLWVYNGRLSTGDEAIPSPRMADRNPNALKDLAQALKDFSGDNFTLCMATLGYAAMSVHFQAILNAEGAFPVCNAYGEPGSFKSLAAEAAASLFGEKWAIDGIVSKLSESALYERLKSTGSILTVYDDPQRGDGKKRGDLDELLKRLYNAKPRVVRGNTQTPHSPVLVTSNHVCGDDSAATRSRLIRLFFPVVSQSPEMKASYPRLREAQKKASGALPDIIALGYPKATIDAIESELLPHLSTAHLRIAKSLAQLIFYTQSVIDMAGEKIDFKQWAIANLCPSENETGNKDSLADFMDKVEILQGQSVLGEWNVKTVNRDGKEYTAIAFNEVWAAVDREFSPPYSKSMILALIPDQGGLNQQAQKFYPDRDSTLAYNRNRLNTEAADPPKTKTKRCSLIPMPDPDNGQGGEPINPNVTETDWETAKNYINQQTTRLQWSDKQLRQVISDRYEGQTLYEISVNELTDLMEFLSTREKLT